MEKLFSVVEVPDFEEEEYDTEYKRSAAWDFEKGDFARDGTNRMVEAEGRTAFACWCYKIAQTERYRCLAYQDSIGTEMERAMDDSDEKTVESMVQRTITEAIMVNPRAEWIRNFNFTWDGDAMQCSFNVKGVDWDEIFTVKI